MPHTRTTLGEWMNILVTGGAGFIGSHLVRALEARGDGVIVWDPRRSGYDVTREIDALFGARTTIHFDAVYAMAAATDVRADDYAQRNDTLDSVLALVGPEMETPRIIFTSSGAVYGDGRLPISTYGACKLGAEGLVNAWAHRTGKRASILRLNNVVGPGCRGVIPDTLRKLRDNPRALSVLGDGSARKRFTHVDEVVRILLDPPDGVHDIAPGDEASVRDVVRWCIEMTKTDPVITWGKEAPGWPGDMTSTYGGFFPGLMSSEAACKRAIYDVVSR